jgi:hypothetical protein
MPRKKKVTDKLARVISRLGRNLKKREKLSDELRELGEKITAAEEAVGLALLPGHYTVNGWSCKIEDKDKGGARSTSWKTVAENTRASIDTIRDEFLDSHPEQSKLIKKLTKRIAERYDQSYKENSKHSDKYTDTIVKVEKTKIS